MKTTDTSKDLDDFFAAKFDTYAVSAKIKFSAALQNRGDLSREAMLHKLRTDLSNDITAIHQRDPFLAKLIGAFKNTRHRYALRPVSNFMNNEIDEFHYHSVRRDFIAEAAQRGWKSRALNMSAQQITKRIAEYMALESLEGLTFLQPPIQTPDPVISTKTGPRRMIIAHKGMTEVVRIFEMMAEARLIDKVNQELLTTIFSKRLADGSIADWDANSYSAQKSEALPKNPDEKPAQTSSEYMVNFVDGLLRLMSPEAKRKLNRN